MFEKAFDRIDLVDSRYSLDDYVDNLLHKLQNGEIKIEDLMGPINGLSELSTFCPVKKKSETRNYTVESNAEFFPLDSFNTNLINEVCPNDYQNPIPMSDPYDLVIIGAGVSGLISAIMANWLGKRCVLIEKHAMGGDCLNTGCVPSKALLSCAHTYKNLSKLSSYGISISGAVNVDFSFIMERMRKIRSDISHHDSVKRYSKEFCDLVLLGEAKFTQNGEIEVIRQCSDLSQAPITLKYHKAMLAVGASPSIPKLLSEIPVLTSHTFFNLTQLPKTLIVIGCGPIGLELAQAMVRLGAKVICFQEGSDLLPKDDREAVSILEQQLLDDGIIIHKNSKLVAALLNTDFSSTAHKGLYAEPWNSYSLTFEIEGIQMTFEANSVLVATGRLPNVEGLGLENVNVEYSLPEGMVINNYFQTSNPSIYACGDCASSFKFTHSADFQARAAIRNMFLGEITSSDDLLIPWCTYTDPEIAHVGKFEYDLIQSDIKFETFVKYFKDIDRCKCDGIDTGFIKLIIKDGTRQIIGATICGQNAGDMISEATLCIQYGITIDQLAGTIHPYPTTQEGLRLAALGFNKYFKNKEGAPIKVLKKYMQEQN